MSNSLISEYLEKMKLEKKHDPEYITLLLDSYSKNEEGVSTAKKLIALIVGKYDQDKKNKT